MATPKENPYLESELRHLMRNEVEVEVFLKLHTMVRIQGTIVAVNVDDRTPTMTVRSLHRGVEKRNILMLGNIASINTVEGEAA